MGKGKRWSGEESLHLAEAWVKTSEDTGEPEVKGTNQDNEEFWAKVIANFAEACPVTSPDGVYNDRTKTAIINHWKEKVSRDVKRFNKSLVKGFASRPTGVTEQEKIHIAVALHLKKADTASSRHKDFAPNDWIFYRCWLALKEHRAFIPPTPEQMEDAVELEDGDDENTDAGDEQSPSNTTVLPVKPSIKPSGEKSRGPGPGSRKTKAMSVEDDYKKKKGKIQEELLEVQKKRQADFAAYVDNQARAQAFKMAVMGYNAFKTEDPEEAEKYKATMNEILCGTVMRNVTGGESGTQGNGQED